MKKIFLIVVTGLLLNATTTWANDNAKAVIGYECTNNSGKAGSGTGRLSLENEYSSFLKKYAKAGEYVIFRYNNRGKEYWFNSSNCSKI